MFPHPAQSIIRSHQRQAPIKVVPLANELGLQVWTAKLPPKISGKLFRSADFGGSSGFAVYVNKDEPPVRQRFTVAHEIGHFLLHRSALEDGEIADDTFYRSRLSSRFEAEANRAAAEILMPWELINTLSDSGLKDASALAEALEVSETAMRIRLGLPT